MTGDYTHNLDKEFGETERERREGTEGGRSPVIMEASVSLKILKNMSVSGAVYR